MVHLKTVAFVAVLLGVGLQMTAQRREPAGVFTAAQAEAGRVSYEETCGRCHTYNLRGRKGDPGELPPVSSLSEADQKFIGTPNHVPPLAGEAFLARWGDKTVAQLIERFQITVSDPGFGFKNITEDTTVNITAYVLQVNGAKAGALPMTRSNNAVVNAVVR